MPEYHYEKFVIFFEFSLFILEKYRYLKINYSSSQAKDTTPA